MSKGSVSKKGKSEPEKGIRNNEEEEEEEFTLLGQFCREVLPYTSPPYQIFHDPHIMQNAFLPTTVKLYESLFLGNQTIFA